MAGPAHGVPLLLLLTLFLLLSLEMNFCHGATITNPRASGSSVAFIKTSCGTTAYPRLCYTSLSAYASKIQTSPVQLANTALSLALVSARSASTVVAKASAARSGMKPRDIAAMRDCIELMGDSVEELRQSLAVMGHLGGKQLGLQINDMQTWVSAALTDDDTCMEGLQGRGGSGTSGLGQMQSTVRTQVLNVVQMTSNALSLINGLVSIRSSSP